LLRVEGVGCQVGGGAGRLRSWRACSVLSEGWDVEGLSLQVIDVDVDDLCVSFWVTSWEIRVRHNRLPG
jgi:hypothetical protein